MARAGLLLPLASFFSAWTFPRLRECTRAFPPFFPLVATKLVRRDEIVDPPAPQPLPSSPIPVCRRSARCPARLATVCPYMPLSLPGDLAFCFSGRQACHGDKMRNFVICIARRLLRRTLFWRPAVPVHRSRRLPLETGEASRKEVRTDARNFQPPLPKCARSSDPATFWHMGVFLIRIRCRIYVTARFPAWSRARPREHFRSSLYIAP